MAYFLEFPDFMQMETEAKQIPNTKHRRRKTDPREIPAEVPVTVTKFSSFLPRWHSPLLHFSIILLLFGDIKRSYVTALKLPDVYWNSSNPMFRIDNTDHIIDVNKSPAEYDRVNIYCPRITAPDRRTGITDSSNLQLPGKDGYYIIYNVSKEEYETCQITNPAARRMLVCDNPLSDRLSYVTITFRPFTPQPNGPEFHAGRDYYFITASTGTEAGLDNKVGGRCASHNMKLIFKVAGKETTDNDDETTMKKTVQARPPQTTFKLPQQERLPVYETVGEKGPVVTAAPTMTIPFFFRPRTTPYRPRIMKYSPQPPSPVLTDDINDLPASEVRSSEANNVYRSVDVFDSPQETTTNDYFNLIREEAAAVTARQTKVRPPTAAANAAIKCCHTGWMILLILGFVAISRMLRSA